MNKNLLIAVICIVIVVLINVLSALPIGFTLTQQTVSVLSAAEVTPIAEEKTLYGGPGYGTTSGPVIHTLTLTNTVIPRQYVLPATYACLYNTQTQEGVSVGTRWQVSSLESKISDFGQWENVVQLGKETKTVELTVDKFVRLKHILQRENGETYLSAEPDFPTGFDTLYLWVIMDERVNFYPQCESLQPADIAMAQQVRLT